MGGLNLDIFGSGGGGAGLLATLLPGVATGLISGLGSYYGAKQQADAQRDVAQSQMDFQERMSNTAYQRVTADMKAAGINPMLAFSEGGASSPSGSMPAIPNIEGAAVESAVSSALDMRRVQKEIQEADSRIRLNKDLGIKSFADAEKSISDKLVNDKVIEGMGFDNVRKGNVANVERKFPNAFGWFDAISRRFGDATGIVRDVTGAASDLNIKYPSVIRRQK